MPRTLGFLAPSLHPNALLDISYYEPGPSAPDPIVKNLTVKHHTHKPLGHVKRIVKVSQNEVHSSLRFDRHQT